MPLIQRLLDQVGWRPALAVLALANLVLGMTPHLAVIDRGTDAPAPSAAPMAGRTAIGWALRRPVFWGLLVGQADKIKILYYDTSGLCLFAKRLQRGRFVWPVSREGVVTLSPAELAMLVEGLDWRAAERTWKPDLAG